MATINVFDVKPTGAGMVEVSLFVRSSVLEEGLASPEAIDAFVQQLKADLDAKAVKAKALLERELAKPLFKK